MNILITSAGRRVSLVNAFKSEIVKYFPTGKIFTVDNKPELSPACHVSDGYFSVPKVTDSLYCKNLVEICTKNNIKIIIPTIDTELIILAENMDYFRDYGILPIVSSLDMIEVCRDKRKTHLFFDSIGFPRANDIDLLNPEFPIFAKPFNGSRSIGIRLIESIEALNEAKLDTNLMFLKYLSPNEHVEYTVDMYFDRNSNLKCIVPRERIEIRAGEVSKGVTRKNEIYDIVLSYFKMCKGFVGCVTLQLFYNIKNGDYFGIEINPRFGGGYPLSYHAGANFPNMIIREYLLDQDIEFYENWKNNLLMLRYDDEILVYDFKG
ncbi:MAG: ATP-grasp domain-containing protein [Tenuifilum sp.]|uniref:ATP-grasp domain-containing protein n=1 Tax=Tenuifilum sp. TaxID=2760880 RepID=UPI0030B28EDC